MKIDNSNDITSKEMEQKTKDWLAMPYLAQMFEVLLPEKGDKLGNWNLYVLYAFFGFTIGVMIYQGMNM
jgi:hypothetical protein